MTSSRTRAISRRRASPIVSTTVSVISIERLGRLGRASRNGTDDVVYGVVERLSQLPGRPETQEDSSVERRLPRRASDTDDAALAVADSPRHPDGAQGSRKNLTPLVSHAPACCHIELNPAT